MSRPNRKDATFADLALPRSKAIRFLERVQQRMLKAAQDHAGDFVARMELGELNSPPNYSIELANGKRLQVFDGTTHKALADDEAPERSRRWSEAAMSFDAVCELLMSLLLQEFDDLRSSSRPKS